MDIVDGFYSESNDSWILKGLFPSNLFVSLIACLEVRDMLSEGHLDAVLKHTLPIRNSRHSQTVKEGEGAESSSSSWCPRHVYNHRSEIDIYTFTLAN